MKKLEAQEAQQDPATEDRTSIEQVIGELRQGLLENAQQLADVWWYHRYERQRKMPASKWGQYGVRVTERAAGVTIEWFRMTFLKSRNGGDSKQFTAMKPVARRGANRLGLNRFPGATDEEKKLIVELEQHFARLREQSDRLSRLARSLRAAEQAQHRSAEEIQRLRQNLGME